MAKIKDAPKPAPDVELTVHNYKKYMSENGYDYLVVKYNSGTIEEALAARRFAKVEDIAKGKYDLSEFYLIPIK